MSQEIAKIGLFPGIDLSSPDRRREQRVRTVADRIAERREAERLAEQMEPATPFTVLKRGDIARLTPPQPIVPGLLYTNTIATIAASGGIGKTALMVAVAASASTGIPFLGKEVRQGRTLYIAGEGLAAMEQRIRAWELHHEVRPGSVTGIDFITGVSLNAKTLELLRAMQERERYQLVVVDTIAANVQLRNENDNAELSHFIRGFRSAVASAPDACGVLLHHVTETTDTRGRKSVKVRGASAIRGDSDTLILGVGTSDGFTLTTEAHAGGKQRDAAPVTITNLALRQRGPHVVVVQQSDAEVVDRDAELRRLVQLMDENRGYQSTELQELWGLATNKGRYQQLRTTALQHGLITKGDGKRDPYIRVPDNGRADGSVVRTVALLGETVLHDRSEREVAS